jgi:hypothetical protein
MTRRQPEAAEQRAIVQLLRVVGCQAWTLGTHRRRGDYQGTNQSPGLPDVLAFLPKGGGLLCVEVKAKGGRLRPEQETYRNACLACEAPWQVHHVVGGQDAVIAYLIGVGLLHAHQVPYYRQPLTLMPDQQDAQDETDAFRARGGRAR